MIAMRLYICFQTRSKPNTGKWPLQLIKYVGIDGLLIKKFYLVDVFFIYNYLVVFFWT